MDHNEFLNKLVLAGLNKKTFSTATGLAYSTVANWSTSNNVPLWVSSWLDNYIKAKTLDIVVEAIKPHIE